MPPMKSPSKPVVEFAAARHEARLRLSEVSEMTYLRNRTDAAKLGSVVLHAYMSGAREYAAAVDPDRLIDRIACLFVLLVEGDMTTKASEEADEDEEAGVDDDDDSDLFTGDELSEAGLAAD